MSDTIDTLNLDEIEVICTNCSFPTVTEYDEKGKVTSFREEEAPVSEEQALAEGWNDHGLGLYCPNCSLAYLEELHRDQEAGVAVGPSQDTGEILDEAFIRGLVPDALESVVMGYVRIFRADRLNKFRVKAGLPPIQVPAPVPADDAEARDWVRISEALEAKGKEQA